MLQEENNLKPLTEKDKGKANKGKSQPIKILAWAIVASAIILSVSSSVELPSNKLRIWLFGDPAKKHIQSASLVKSPKDMEECTTKIFKVDKECKFLTSFTVNGPEIIYNGPSQKWAQLIAYKPIPYNETFRVRVQVVFSANRHIMLGMTNHNRVASQSSFFNEHTYAYYGQNGCLWAEGQLMLKDGQGFLEKDVVQMQVQLWEGLVQWKVNGVLRGQVFSQNLKKREIVFVPYLEMFQKGDSIRSIS